MKILFLFICLNLGAAMAISDNNRIIILSGEGVPSAREKLLQYKNDLEERDVVIKEKPSSEEFKIELIGKDETKKWEDDEDFQVSEILEKIDSMPMRQREM